MALDKRVRWLVKEEADGSQTIFQWTPTLAIKKGFRPVTIEDAEKIIEGESKKRAEKFNARYTALDLPDNNPVIEKAIEEGTIEAATSPVGGEDLKLIK